MRTFELEVRKLTMFVSFGNARGSQQGVGPRLCPAITTRHTAFSTGELPSTSTTNRTNFSGNLHHLVSVSLCTVRLVLRKCPEWKLCAQPVELWDDLWTTEKVSRWAAKIPHFFGTARPFFDVLDRSFTTSRTTRRNDCAWARKGR